MRRALVVDDNDMNLKILNALLKRLDVECVLAHGGEEAIILLEKEQVDIVFMDHLMPEMDGIETLEAIRRKDNPVIASLSVVAVSADDSEHSREFFIHKGFQDYLSKPVKLTDLQNVLEKFESDKDNPVPMPIDEEGALEKMGGMLELYESMLEYALELETSRKQELEKCFANEDYKEYEIKVHSLKGAMACLGVMELARLAEQQETACREHRYADVREGHMELLSAYERTHRSIEQRLKGDRH